MLVFNSLKNNPKDVVKALKETAKLAEKLQKLKDKKKVHDYVNEGLKKIIKLNIIQPKVNLFRPNSYTRLSFYCIMVPIEIEKYTNNIMKGDL